MAARSETRQARLAQACTSIVSTTLCIALQAIPYAYVMTIPIATPCDVRHLRIESVDGTLKGSCPVEKGIRKFRNAETTNVGYTFLGSLCFSHYTE
eukprot:scaffold18587_cov40-Prasinocladus_malaysianus.AAC.1